jgi:hypothetical protein
MKTLLTSVLLLLGGVLFGQQFSYPTIRAQGQSLQDFVPAGWTIRDSATGDLDRDRRPDAALVLQHRDSVALTKERGDTVLTQPRMLLVLLWDSLGRGFRLQEQSNTFVLNHDDPVMDEPFYGLHIHRGGLTISFQLFYSMGSWYTTFAAYHFQFRNNQLALIGADYSSIHRASMDYEDYSFNFLTRKVILIKGNEEKGSKHTTAPLLVLPRLKTLKDLREPFGWEVQKDIFL